MVEINYRNWSSFNSNKIFSHIDRWKYIQKGICPPPVLITVDPANYCNLSCEWCNAWKVRENERYLSKKALFNLVNFISNWEDSNKFKVNAVCIAGGGEPLCNPYVGDFLIELDYKKIKTATVTNGVLIDHYLKELLTCQYVAVSVDAASKSTFNKYKGLNNNSNTFEKVISNMKLLCDASRKENCNLGKESQSNGINYRMLLYKDNIQEISEAARIAQEIGCKNLHIRPASLPFDKIKEFEFTDDDIKLIDEQVRIVEATKKKDFGFYYTYNKFNDKLKRCNDFNYCFAVFMTATIMPPIEGGSKDSFCLNLCCDRRSDSNLRLLTNENDVNKISQIWGKDKHWEIFKSITKLQIMKVCPRCTYYEHNKIYQNCILNDNMLIDFI